MAKRVCRSEHTLTPARCIMAWRVVAQPLLCMCVCVSTLAEHPLVVRLCVPALAVHPLMAYVPKLLIRCVAAWSRPMRHNATNLFALILPRARALRRSLAEAWRRRHMRSCPPSGRLARRCQQPSLTGRSKWVMWGATALVLSTSSAW